MIINKKEIEKIEWGNSGRWGKFSRGYHILINGTPIGNPLPKAVCEKTCQWLNDILLLEAGDHLFSDEELPF